ncbi:MAG: acylglycerol kinase family protein, partial [Thermodesulfobacteriota bacterium]
MKIRFIVNPISGGKEKVEAITNGVARVFSNVDGIFEIRATRFQGDAVRLSREAVLKGYETVFACGGDGTINEVASALVGTETVLGILPVGSGNALARSLGIPFGTIEAFGLPLKGRVKAIDAG